MQNNRILLNQFFDTNTNELEHEEFPRIQNGSLSPMHFSKYHRLMTKSDTFSQKFKLADLPCVSNPSNYKMLLIRSVDSSALIDHFVSEPFGLRKSRISKTDFSISSCVSRFIEGYPGLLFEYNSPVAREVVLSISEDSLIITRNKQLEKLKFNLLKGIFLGANSKTFMKFKEISSLKKTGVSISDCFSILSGLRSYDLAVTDFTAKYDIPLVLSWYISGFSSHPSMIPIPKYCITRHNVLSKIKEMASERHLFFGELFHVIYKQLAIIKSLILNNAEEWQIEFLKDLIDKKFFGCAKIVRMFYKFRPEKFKTSNAFMRKESNVFKNMFLKERKRINKQMQDIPPELKIKYNWDLIKRSRNTIVSLVGVKPGNQDSPKRQRTLRLTTSS